MPYLTSYRIYYDNIDLLSDLNPDRNKILERECLKRKNVVYSLAKNDKFKHLSKKSVEELITNFII